jgi:chemotaxis signal transduction protein
MSSLNPDRSSTIVRCKVGSDSFVLDLGQVSGFQRAERLRAVREAGPAPFALVSPAGEVPVFGLAGLLGRSQPLLQPSQHVILIRTAAGLWGLLADQVSRALKVEAGAHHPLPLLLHAWPAVPADQVVVLQRTEAQLLLIPERLHPEGRQAYHPAFRSAPVEQRRPGRVAQGQLLVFAPGECWAGPRRLLFGLNLALLQEVIDLPTLVPVPCVPDSVLGLIVWRDQVLPVVDLGRCLGLPLTQLQRCAHLLVVATGTDAGLVCFPVLPGIRMSALPVPHYPCTRPLPLDLARAHGAVELQRETLVMPNLKKILAGPGSLGLPP